MRTLLHGIELCDLTAQFPDAHGASASYTHAPEAIIGVSLHHGGVKYQGTTLRDDLLYAQASYEWDLRQLGGIGYQLMASPSGRLFLTRPLNTWGCHTAGLNDRLLGICAMGDWRFETPPDAMLCALSLGLIILWRWCGGLRVVRGHGQWPHQSTECPGQKLIDSIPKILTFAEFNAKRYP